MKIASVPFLPSIYTKKTNSITTDAKTVSPNKEIKELSNFPKSYLTGIISFGGINTREEYYGKKVEEYNEKLKGKTPFEKANFYISQIKKNQDEYYNLQKKNIAEQRWFTDSDEIKERFDLKDYPEYIHCAYLEAHLDDANKIFTNEIMKIAIPTYKPEEPLNETDSTIKSMVETYIEAKLFDKQQEIDKLEKQRDRDLAGCHWYHFGGTKKLIKANHKKALEQLDLKEKAIKATLGSEATYQKIFNDKHGIPQTQMQALSKLVNVMNAFSTENRTLDERIAGYDIQKKYVQDAIILPLRSDDPEKPEIPVPKALLIFGPIGTGKTEFAKAVAQETGAYVEKCEPVKTGEFAEYAEDLLQDAKDRYIKTGQRTIIIVDEADKYIDLSPENKKNVTSLKRWLDNCSKRPGDGLDSGNATTFIFTTNHPMDITDEIRNRYGKIGDPLALPAPEKNDIEKILKFYIEKASKGNDWLDEENKLTDEEKTKSTTKKPIIPENIDVNRIITKFLKTSNDGSVYSGDRIRKIAIDAYKNYINDPDETATFKYHLRVSTQNARTDIEKYRIDEFATAEEKLTKPRKQKIEDLENIIEDMEDDNDPDEKDKLAELKEELAILKDLESRGVFDIYGDNN